MSTVYLLLTFAYNYPVDVGRWVAFVSMLTVVWSGWQIVLLYSQDGSTSVQEGLRCPGHSVSYAY